MIENSFYVIVFDSTHFAIKTEKTLKKEVQVDMIPTPREISASCGLSVKFIEENLKSVLGVLKNAEKKGMYLYKLTKVSSGSRIVECCNWGD